MKQAVAHGISLLDRGQNQAFLDQFVSPEDLAHILKDTSKSEFVSTFVRDKRASVRSMLGEIVNLAPVDIRTRGNAVGVVYRVHDGREVTFIVDGAHVFIRN